ncbi:MAG: LacI family DNA-binding transcriptional regulator [Spirochaetota bacterium]
MSKTATIYDVAKQAGVSITTVSRYLNTPGRVAVHTQYNILQAMRQLEFIPKAEAVARARTNTKRIGVLTPSLTGQSFVQRIEAIHRELCPVGYEMISYIVDSQEQLDRYLTVLPTGGRVDALIILALPLSEQDVERFREHRIPVVGIEYSREGISSIEIDNVAGGCLAANYLLSNGYKQMGFVGESGQPVYSLLATEQRLEGFLGKLSELGYPVDRHHVCFHVYGTDQTIEAALQLLESPYRPDALFCASDFQAACVLKAARMLDIRVPEELGILGFDDTETAQFMELSTIRQNLDRSGELAAKLVIEQLKKPESRQKAIQLDLSIVERNTTSQRR